MGNAVAEAVVKAGLNLVPYTITGESVAVNISDVNVQGKAYVQQRFPQFQPI